jgi:hypothetical protein
MFPTMITACRLGSWIGKLAPLQLHAAALYTIVLV